jgi:hypothetical protein
VSPGGTPEIDQERTALRKAAVWSLVAGVTHLVAPIFAPGSFPTWYFALSAVAFGLMLPAIASLHVRHALVRQSGAVLGTIAGTSVVTLGSFSASQTFAVPAAFFVTGIWWWTIGKMWAETRVLPRAFGWITMALAIVCFALVAAYAYTGILMAVPDLPLRMILGVWLITLAGLLWRDAGTMNR